MCIFLHDLGFGENDFCPTCRCTPEEAQPPSAMWWQQLAAGAGLLTGEYFSSRAWKEKMVLAHTELVVWHFSTFLQTLSFAACCQSYLPLELGPEHSEELGQCGPGCRETAVRAASDWSTPLILAADWLSGLSLWPVTGEGLTGCFSPQ